MIIETKQDIEIREKILESMEEVSGVPREYFEFYRSKKPVEVYLRSIYVYLMYQFTEKTKVEIKELVGLKNHASVIKAIEDIETWKKDPEEYKSKYNLFKQILQHYGQKH